tara:strand:- start:632 stop:952 length:321 start_codon:yes stop_codon:yes gene_type:complete
MKVLKRLTILGVASFLLTSCSITKPLAVTSNSLGKTGSSKNTCIFPISSPTQTGAGYVISSGICLNSKYGVKEAAENAGISKVGAVDIKVTDFGLFRTYELIVSGE